MNAISHKAFHRYSTQVQFDTFALFQSIRDNTKELGDTQIKAVIDAFSVVLENK